MLDRARSLGIAIILACSVSTFLAADARGQQPRFGIGAAGGVFLGSRLIDQRFGPFADDEQTVFQQVHISEVPTAGGHLEWYGTRWIALRIHAASGKGRLESNAQNPEGDTDLAPFESGFGDVRVLAYDVGIAFWPWAPRSVGFAPFLTIGTGTVRYRFNPGGQEDAFFRPPNSRSRHALVLGAGADMFLWRGIVLRFEAVNHRADAPLEARDFALNGEPRERSHDDSVSNIRLVLGGHVYLPFANRDGLDD